MSRKATLVTAIALAGVSFGAGLSVHDQHPAEHHREPARTVYVTDHPSPSVVVHVSTAPAPEPVIALPAECRAVVAAVESISDSSASISDLADRLEAVSQNYFSAAMRTDNADMVKYGERMRNLDDQMGTLANDSILSSQEIQDDVRVCKSKAK